VKRQTNGKGDVVVDNDGQVVPGVRYVAAFDRLDADAGYGLPKLITDDEEEGDQ
jgi:hypothetical protein